MSMLGNDEKPGGHAESPHAAGQVVVAAGVPSGRNGKTDVGP
jgi:hypothetical protein